MNKQEFLKALSDRLQGIPKEDREKSLEYYSEMIDDRTEDGLTEEQAVKAMGNVDEISDKIINDTPIEKLIRKKVDDRFPDMVSDRNITYRSSICIVFGFMGADTVYLCCCIYVCGVGNSLNYCTFYEHLERSDFMGIVPFRMRHGAFGLGNTYINRSIKSDLRLYLSYRKVL